MGGRQTKIPRATDAEREVAAQGDALDALEAQLRTSMVSIGLAIDSGDASPATVRELASVGRVMISLSAERRARVKQERRHLQSITPATILAWFREQDPASRAQMVREVVAIDQKRSGLG